MGEDLSTSVYVMPASVPRRGPWPWSGAGEGRAGDVLGGEGRGGEAGSAGKLFPFA